METAEGRKDKRGIEAKVGNKTWDCVELPSLELSHCSRRTQGGSTEPRLDGDRLENVQEQCALSCDGSFLTRTSRPGCRTGGTYAGIVTRSRSSRSRLRGTLGLQRRPKGSQGRPRRGMKAGDPIDWGPYIHLLFITPELEFGYDGTWWNEAERRIWSPKS